MSDFSYLSYQMRRYASEHGMRAPRRVQEEGAVALLRTDKNVIISGPTSCGKTFAVYGALFSMLDFSERGVKVLDFLPTKALVNDQCVQVGEMGEYAFVPVHKWDGDVKQSEKNKLVKEPFGVLLITPESVEGRMHSNPEQLDEILAGLRFIVMDEMHHYYGTERGRHILSLVHRVQERVGRARVIGISATIGKDDYLAKTYTGDAENTIVVRDRSLRQTDFSIRYYPKEDENCKDLPEELIGDVYAATRDEDGLVFCNSRGMAEEVAVALKRREPGNEEKYGAHHSSVSIEERERVEENARQGRTTPCCTSTMELGVNIGTVSVVCLIESPNSVSSFIQRAGRSGRKTGKSVVRLFCSDKWSLLRGIACWNLFNRGYAEDPDNTVEWHNVALQQVVSTVKEKGIISKQALIEAFKKNPSFPFSSIADYESYIDCGLSERLFDLSEAGEGLVLGTEGEKLFKGKDSCIVFPTTNDYRVMYQDIWVGDHERSMEDKKGDCFYLSSKVWEITGIDDKRHRFHVIPAPEGRKPRFTSFGMIVGKELEQEMKEILLSTEQYPFLDEKGCAALSELRAEFSKCDTMGRVSMPYHINEAGQLCIYPFAGTKIYNTLKLLFNATGEGYMLNMGIPLERFKEKARSIKECPKSLLPTIEAMIERGEIPLKHKYEKYLDLQHQARLELTKNFNEAKTREYIGELLTQ